MNRGTWIVVLALALFAAPTHGADEAKKDSPPSKTSAAPKKKPRKPGDAKGAKAPPESGGSAAWGTGGAAKGSVASKKSATAAPKHAAERVAMLRQRAILRYSIESCEQSKNCDTALREDAEHRFMDACLPCATREQCEAERDAIRAGSSKGTTDLCSD